MGARLRRSGKAGVVSMLVALGLIASAWLAYASSAPNGTSSYPPPSTTTTTKAPTTTTTLPTTTTTKPAGTPQIRIKGKGYCGSKDSLSRFQFDVRRDQNNQLKGNLHTQIGDSQHQFQVQQLTSLTVNGNTASFSINGELHGPHLTKAQKNATYTADVVVTDNNPDTWQISIHNSSVIYTNSCPVSGGGIVFENTH
jgi:hypothetical protein